MDADRFLRELPGLFEDYPRSEHPLDRRFEPVLAQVENLAAENVLALLNLAASCLGPEEAYVEIGVLHGASLIGAMLGNEEHRFIGIDDFRKVRELGLVFRQITENDYRAELRAVGASPIHAFAVAFDGKRVRVKAVVETKLAPGKRTATAKRKAGKKTAKRKVGKGR